MRRALKNQLLWYLAVYILVALSVMAAALFFYRAQMREIQGEAENQLMAVADLKVQEIVSWRKERISDAELLKNTTLFQRAALSVFGGRAGVEEKTIIEQKSRLYSELYGYKSLILVDAEGRVAFATEGAETSNDGFNSPYMRAAVKTGEVVFSDFHRHKEASSPILGLFVPVSSFDGMVAGVAILQIDPADFLYPLIQDWPVPSETAETLLVRREGDGVLFLNDLRHSKDTALRLLIPLEERSLPASMAVMGAEGMVEGKDYRGVEVMAALKAVPGSPWYLSAKVDLSEVFSPMRRIFAMLLIFVAAVFAIGAAAGYLVWKRQRHLEAVEQMAFAEHYHSFSKYANDAMFLVDEEFRLREVNDAACERYGYTREELLSMRVPQMHFDEDRDEISRLMGEVRANQSNVFECRHRRKDGTAVPVELSVRAVEVDGGRWSQAIARDITDRKISEGKLLRYAELMEEMGKIARIGAWEVDFSTGSQTWTGEVYRIHEVGDDFVPTLEKGIDFFAPEAREKIRILVDGAAREGKPYDVILPFVTAKGRRIWVRAKGAAVKEGERIVKVRGIIQDITKEKESEVQLERYAERLEEMVEERSRELEKARSGLYAQEKLSSLGRMGAGIAHQFNTPIGVGMLYVDALLERCTGMPEQHALLQKIRNLLDEMKAVVESMLALARVKRRDQAEINKTQINEVLERVVDMAAMECNSRGILIRTEFAEGLPRIDAAVGDLEQIFMNLVTNAIDAMPSGGKLRVESSPAENGIRVIISDTGVGIPEENMDRVFEPFFTERKGGKGTGLGLSIAHDMVERYGGEITVSSKEGKGSTFEVFISETGIGE